MTGSIELLETNKNKRVLARQGLVFVVEGKSERGKSAVPDVHHVSHNIISTHLLINLQINNEIRAPFEFYY